MKRLVTSTLVLAGFTALGVSAAGGTYAFLTSTATAPGATVKAGSQSININDYVNQDAILGVWYVAPAIPVAGPFTVNNTGDTPVSLTATIASTSTTALTADATARVFAAVNGECAADLSATRAPLQGYTSPVIGTLAPHASMVVCLEVGLKPDTDTSHSGQGLDFTVTVNAKQEAS